MEPWIFKLIYIIIDQITPTMKCCAENVMLIFNLIICYVRIGSKYFPTFKIIDSTWKPRWQIWSRGYFTKYAWLFTIRQICGKIWNDEVWWTKISIWYFSQPHHHFVCRLECRSLTWKIWSNYHFVALASISNNYHFKVRVKYYCMHEDVGEWKLYLLTFWCRSRPTRLRLRLLHDACIFISSCRSNKKRQILMKSSAQL